MISKFQKHSKREFESKNSDLKIFYQSKEFQTANFGQGRPNAPILHQLILVQKHLRNHANQKILTMILLELFDFKVRIFKISKIHFSIMGGARGVWLFQN
jgi:hypothetical protein